MKNWLTPPPLKRGDTVGIVAPSDMIEEKYLSKSVAILKKWGLKIKYGKYLFENDFSFSAGTPSQRLEDLLSMWFDPKVKIIWAALGGYSATQLWPLIDVKILRLMRKNPKWVIGYSDVCTLLHIEYSNKVKSLHGPNLSGLYYWDEESRNELRKLLFRKKTGMVIKSGVDPLVDGVASGRLLVSNLDTLITSFGTRFDPIAASNENIILGIEELQQYKSSIQRQMDMVMNHKNSKRIKGVIIGRFTEILNSDYTKWSKSRSAEAIVCERVRAVNQKIPVILFSRFGHMETESMSGRLNRRSKDKTFLTFVNGSKVTVRAKDKKAEIKILG